MATSTEEWKKYFVAVNGRLPSLEEFQEAVRTGDIRDEDTVVHAITKSQFESSEKENSRQRTPREIAAKELERLEGKYAQGKISWDEYNFRKENLSKILGISPDLHRRTDENSKIIVQKQLGVQENPEDQPSAGWAILSFFFPFVGFILIIVFAFTHRPKMMKNCLHGFLFGILCTILLVVLYFTVLAGLFAGGSWNASTTVRSSSISKVSVASKEMDLGQIEKGDYSSIQGTWKSEDGTTTAIADEKVLYIKTNMGNVNLNGLDVTQNDFAIQGNAGVADGSIADNILTLYPGTVNMEFIPVGVPIIGLNGLQVPSDDSKSRIFIDGSAVNNGSTTNKGASINSLVMYLQ